MEIKERKKFGDLERRVEEEAGEVEGRSGGDEMSGRSVGPTQRKYPKAERVWRRRS